MSGTVPGANGGINSAYILPTAPFVNPATGTITAVWWRFLMTLLARTGGASGLDIVDVQLVSALTDLDPSATVDLDALTALLDSNDGDLARAIEERIDFALAMQQAAGDDAADGSAITFDLGADSDLADTSELIRALLGGDEGSASTTSATSETTNAQTGTTYTILTTDAGKLVTFANASPIAVTLPQAGGSFPDGFVFDVQNIGAGLVTITPTTSTIGGATAFYLITGGGARIISNGTNYLVLPHPALYTLASSAISNWVPGVPSSAKGGNARGTNAVDIQGNGRSLATQVASGNSAVAVGSENTASGSSSSAVGNSNTASGSSAVAVGINNTASTTDSLAFGNGNVVQTGSTGMAFGKGNNVSGAFAGAVGWNGSVTGANSYSLGYNAGDHGNKGALARATGNITGNALKSGPSQIEEYTLYATTTGATAVRLTADGGAASSSSIANLANNSAASFTAEILIFDITTNKSATYSVAQSLIERAANAASTTVTLNGGGVVAGPASGTPFTLAAAPTITADTTNGGFDVSYTPPVANTDTFWAICYLRLITLRNV